MLERKDFYAKLHIVSKRKLKTEIEHVIITQKNNLHAYDGHVMKMKVNKIIPLETINPSFFKFTIKLPQSFIQNNHNKVVYAISIWDAKTNNMIKACNFKSPEFYVISKHKPTIIFSVPVEF